MLQNNITTILADDADVPPGKVDQMRLVLGTNNSVVIDGASFELRTPSYTQTGLTFDMNVFLKSNKKYEALIDFDAHQSIVSEGVGAFILKPTIKVESFNER